MNKYKVIFWLFCRDVSWDEIKNLVYNELKSAKSLDVILQYARELSSDESKEVIEATASFIFLLFLKEKMLLRKHISSLKLIFGCASSSLATNIFQVSKLKCVVNFLRGSEASVIFQIVHSIVSSLGDEAIHKLEKKCEQKRSAFGTDVKFTCDHLVDWDLYQRSLSQVCDLDELSKQIDDVLNDIPKQVKHVNSKKDIIRNGPSKKQEVTYQLWFIPFACG